MYNSGINTGLDKKLNNAEIARKIFLSYPTYIFKDKLDIEFDIRNKISLYFNIPIMSVQVAGSAKTGYSYHKNKNFQLKISDLDISIISEKLYLQYIQVAYRTTNDYSDLRKFLPTKKLTGNEVYESFKHYVSKGIIRPDLLPSCTEKQEWFDFFTSLSKEYSNIFKDINAGIYCNEYFFEHKQADVIKQYKKAGGI